MESDPPSAVRLVRELSAPVDHVCHAWTAPDWVRRWFGSDPRGTVRSARLDVRPGGTFQVAFVDGDGLEHACRGTYLAVEPMRRLVFTWTWQSEPGVETQVTVELQPSGSGTRLALEHAKLSPSSAHDYQAGWGRTLDKLQRALGPDR